MAPFVIIWVWLCAYLNCAGWVLSAGHALDRSGYAVTFVIGLVAFFVWKQKTSIRLFHPAPWRKLRWRFRHAFPLGFLILAGLAALGGALYLPANYDSLAYRTPRVLYWLTQHQWYWVHTEFARLNTRTAGFEWVTAPIILFTGTDRFLFLLNIICFLLLPGRIFAVLTRLGVRPRTAWYWMWLLPGGYGYVLQAGSIVNDLFGGFMALVAFEFALRASRQKDVSLFWTALVAVAMMTAAKAFNIVLLLPWALAALPAVPTLWRRPVASFAVILFAAGASIVPTAILNVHECGDWTGLKAEQAVIGGGGKPERFIVNAINLPMNNLAPPVFPFASQWNHLVSQIVPEHVTAMLLTYIEGSSAKFEIPDMQVEESAGLGLGVCLLLLFLLVKKIRAREFTFRKCRTVETLVPLAAWLSLMVFMMEVGSSGPARYLSPFYILLVVPFLTGTVPSKMTRSRPWHTAGLVVFAVAAFLVILTPPRPLWPALTVLRHYDAEHSSNHLLQRAWTVYDVYRTRADGFETVIAALPPDAQPLGLLEFDEPDAALWRPFGSRRIEQFCRADSPAQLAARGIKYALVSERFFDEHIHMNCADWIQKMNATVVQRFDLRLLAGKPSFGWLLVRFP